MSKRVNIKVDKETRERIAQQKREGETWDGLLRRAADALDDRAAGRSTPGVCASCGDGLSTWTVVDGDALCLDCAGIDESEALPDAD